MFKADGLKAYLNKVRTSGQCATWFGMPMDLLAPSTLTDAPLNSKRSSNRTNLDLRLLLEPRNGEQCSLHLKGALQPGLHCPSSCSVWVIIRSGNQSNGMKKLIACLSYSSNSPRFSCISDISLQ